MVNYQQLAAADASAYKSLTFPKFQHYLQQLQPDGTIVAIGASDAGKPVGLVLGELEPHKSTAHMRSIFVQPSYRSTGIAKTLFAQFEQVLIKRRCQTVQIAYMSNRPTTAALEHLLQQLGWAQPVLDLLICKGTEERIIHAPWLREFHLPADYTMFLWKDLTSDDRRSMLERQQLQPWMPDDLIPFQYETDFEPINSMGLRYQGQVVGWLITHRTAQNTIRYTSSFVRRDLQKMGRVLPLYVAAIQRQIQVGITEAIWLVPANHPAMVSFVRKRMAPYLVSVEEARKSSKVLVVHSSSDGLNTCDYAFN